MLGMMATAQSADAPPKADPPAKTDVSVKTDAPAKTEAVAKTDTSAKTDPPAKTDAPANSGLKVIDRKAFTLKYPTAWKEATDDPDYKADSHFSINGPDKKNSYVSFDIVDKTADPSKLLSSTIEGLDGSAVAAQSKTKLEAWGSIKCLGMDLKGKLLGTYTGGIRVFCFTSDHHSFVVTEWYWQEELKDLQPDLDCIRQNFVLKD